MDPVPKKIKRHVFKALQTLSKSDDHEQIRFGDIFNCVQYSTRNLVPTPNLKNCVRRSLQMYEHSGLVRRNKKARYILRKQIFGDKQIAAKIFRSQGLYSKKRFVERSRRDPESKRRRHSSDESISGDEIDKVRKRSRGIRQGLSRNSRGPHLPGARKHPMNIKEEKCDSNLSDVEIVSPEDEELFHPMQFSLLPETPRVSERFPIQNLTPPILNSAMTTELFKNDSISLNGVYDMNQETNLNDENNLNMELKLDDEPPIE